MEKTNRWYPVEYAGFWNIQYEDAIGSGYDVLDGEVVGRSVAEYNAKLCASAPQLLEDVEKWKQTAGKLYKELEWCLTNPACDDIELKQVMKEYEQLIKQDGKEKE